MPCGNEPNVFRYAYFRWRSSLFSILYHGLTQRQNYSKRKKTREKHRRLFSNFQFKTYFLTAIRGYSRFNWTTHLLHISWIVDCCSCAENNTMINTNRIQPSNDEIVDAMQPVLWVWSHSVCLHLFYSHFNFFNNIYGAFTKISVILCMCFRFV